MDLSSIVNSKQYFCSDSRKASNDAIFVALKGESRDGHDFVEALLGDFPHIQIVVELSRMTPAWGADPRVTAVESTHTAHRELAQLFRERWKPRVIAVGGSSGKTSTKEFLKTLLEPHFEMFSTDKSQNGEQGIPKTFESLRSTSKIALIEVGIDTIGDMQRHASLVQPDIAVLTSIGEEHLQYLKDVDTVFAEERKLFDVCLARGGVCFAPRADAYLSRFDGVPGCFLSPEHPEDVRKSFHTELTHPYALRNAALAASIALHVGVSEADVAHGLRSLELPDGRGRTWTNKRGQTVIADHYNSNPASLRAGLVYAQSFASRGESVSLFLGDMLELGPETLRYHKDVLAELKSFGAHRLVLVGPLFTQAANELGLSSAECFASSDEAAHAIGGSLGSEVGVLMFKGSRGMRLEKLLDLL